MTVSVLPPRRLPAVVLAAAAATALIGGGAPASAAPAVVAAAVAATGTVTGSASSAKLSSTAMVLRAGQSITNAQYRFTFQADGNAVLSGNGRPLWSTKTTTKAKGGRLQLGKDGILGVYNAAGQRVWKSPNAASAGARLSLQTDGNLVLRRSTGSALWHIGRPGAESIVPGAVLKPGHYLLARSGAAKLSMQSDGRLVQAGSRGGAVWTVSCPAGSSFSMGGGGAVKVVSGAGKVCWQAAGLTGTGPALSMQANDQVIRKTSAGTRLLTPSSSLAGYTMGPQAAAVFGQINKDRAARGVPVLTFDARLFAAAQRHNTTMAAANQLAHQLAGEASFSSRLTAAGYPWTSCAENIGVNGDTSTAGALQLQSIMMAEVAPNDGHKVNILNPGYTQVGVAVLVVGGKLWLTQDFGRP